MELPSLISSLSLIDDRRSNKNKRYSLPLLLLIAFCASISKHDSWYSRIMPKHMRQVLGSFKSCSSERSLSMSRPPTIPSIELFSSSHTKSSNKPIKTGSQPYFGGMMKLVKSALMARPCAESRSLALTPSHTSHRPITLIFSRFSLWMQCPSSATSWSLSVGSWMSWMYTSGRMAGASAQAKRPRIWSYWPR